MIELVPARLTHVGPIATKMREADRKECWALGRTPKEALRLGILTGEHTLTALDDGIPAAMMGLHIMSLLSGSAAPWFLGTNRVFMHPRELLCTGRRILSWWKAEFPHLENIVSVENGRAIRLLKHWGFEVGGREEMHRGVAFVPFRAIQEAEPRP